MRKISSLMTLILVVCLAIGGVSASWIYAAGPVASIFKDLFVSMSEWEFGYKVSFINNGNNLVEPIQVTDNSSEFVIMNSTGTGINNVTNAAAKDAAEAAQTQMGSRYEFSHWINAGSTRVDSIPAGNTEDVTLYPSFVGVYTATFVKQDGTVVKQVTFYEGQTELNAGDIPEVPTMEGSGFVTFQGSWEEYTLGNADITIYPHYEISTVNLGFTITSVDEDADGDTDYYVMEVESNVGADITVPGYINGCPILIVKDLTSGSDAKDVVNIKILEGVEELSSSASTGAAKLETVALPRSLKRITGANIFGNGNKQIAITYAGTVEEFLQIQKIDGWDNGLGSGTTIKCSDGVIYCNGKSSWRYNDNSININPNPYNP